MAKNSDSFEDLQECSQKRILIKLISSVPRIFANIKKYITYINQVLADQTSSGLYIEDIKGGLLYIYRDFKTFKLMNNPTKPYITNQAQKSLARDLKEKRSNENFFLKTIFNELTFPDHGISIYYETETEPVEEIFKSFEQFVRNNIQNGYQILKNSSNCLEIKFLSFKSFKEYCDNVEKLFYKPL